MKIHCVPYAGGNAHSYRPLQAHLPAFAVEGLELPGRGSRVGEPLSRSLEGMAGDLFSRAAAAFMAGPYVLFGHSMGAALAYLLLHRIREAGLPPPRAVVLSGKSAPSIPESRARHRLVGHEFRDMLARLGGCPPEVIAEQELMDYFEPILRADFEAVETWRPARREPLNVPALVLHGREDEIPRSSQEAWTAEFTVPIELHEFDWGHFFIQQHWPAIARLVIQLIDRSS